MSTYTPLSAPATLEDAISPLAILDNHAVDIIDTLVHGERSFSPSKDEILRLSEQIGISKDGTEFIFVALSLLYNHIHSASNSPIQFEAVVDNTVQELSVKSKWDENIKRNIYDRLVRLLVKNVNHSTFKKVERLKAGFQKHAIGFSSFVELRPRYTGEDPLELSIDGYVPTMQFRISTDSADDKEFVFQLTESALAEFKKAVERLDTKIAVLKQAAGSEMKIVDL